MKAKHGQAEKHEILYWNNLINISIDVFLNLLKNELFGTKAKKIFPSPNSIPNMSWVNDSDAHQGLHPLKSSGKFTGSTYRKF